MRKLNERPDERDREGQTTTEYVIIIGVVALGSIAVILLFGNQVRSMYGAATRKSAGMETELNTEPAEQTHDAERVNTMVDAFETTDNGS